MSDRERQVRLFRHGSEQALCIPAEFETEAQEAVVHTGSSLPGKPPSVQSIIVAAQLRYGA
ncbi:MAG: hypothetical protein GKR94_28640 [Gammaproteobacteria bacterium]|nr:hypothetical protein [Gammaproteobacteria bacterium]